MDYRIYKIYNVNNKHLFKAPNMQHGNHDVIYLGQTKNHKKAKVVTITSLEKPSKNGKGMHYLLNKFDDVKNGRIIAIPTKDLKSSHWSGIFKRKIYVDKKYLANSKHCKQKKLPIKYRKLL